MRAGWMVLAGAALVAIAQTAPAQEGHSAGGLAVEEGQLTFSARQARYGRQAYRTSCALCHGMEMEGLAGSALIGDEFHEKWQGQTAFDLYEYIRTGMPRDDPGAYSEATYTNATVYVLQANGIGVPASNGPDLPVEEWSQIQLDWE